MGKGPSVGKDVFANQQDLATGFGQKAASLVGTAQGQLGKASDFWSGLLQGGKGAQNLVAPSAMNISQVYQGNQNAIKNFAPAGGERNLALAQNQNAKARSIADLYANVQPLAAQQLAGLGGGILSGATGLGGLANQGNNTLIDYQAQKNAAKGQALGGIGGGLGTIAGAGILRCWVAEVLYGRFDERTFAIRHWLLRGRLPWNWKLFDFAYGAVGARLAPALRQHPGLQRFIRPLFDQAFKRAMVRVAQHA